MEKADIESRIGRILSTVLRHNQFTLSDELTASQVAGWDSLSHMIIIGDIETEFGIRFKLRELGKLENLGALISLIREKIKPGA